ncbi:GNAT family N-acetyltransferase [Butyrivibrio sp. AE3004]|uniref:GNAT family N-acetyltransferase n=1 Tax=Butyrivibrio sp. AE3004 TaxID=1506994 RepID=UPI00049480CE|nr:GNAT family N-acetyltransferase [Butyrivibrio sp. AE3004]
MEELEITRITDDAAELFEGMLPEYVVDLLKNKKIVTSLAAVLKNKVIGALSGFAKDGYFEIISIYVHPQYRRNGVGRALIEAVKEMLEDTDLFISAEYTAMDEDTNSLSAFFEACDFAEDRDEYPFYLEDRLKHLKVRTKSQSCTQTDIRMLSKITADDLKRAGNEDIPVTLNTMTAQNILAEESFIAIDNGLMVAVSLAEELGEKLIRLYTFDVNPNNMDRLTELLSYTEEALKGKYEPDTKVILLACNPRYEELFYSILKYPEIISHRMVYMF